MLKLNVDTGLLSYFMLNITAFTLTPWHFPTTGNWSPSDFPEGSTFSSYEKTHESINRDLLVVMSGDSVVEAFQTVFENDWKSGTDWKPKH